MAETRASPQKYPLELKERAVTLAFETVQESGGVKFGIVRPVAEQVSANPETLCIWVGKAEVDGGA